MPIIIFIALITLIVTILILYFQRRIALLKREQLALYLEELEGLDQRHAELLHLQSCSDAEYEARAKVLKAELKSETEDSKKVALYETLAQLEEEQRAQNEDFGALRSSLESKIEHILDQIERIDPKIAASWR